MPSHAELSIGLREHRVLGTECWPDRGRSFWQSIDRLSVGPRLATAHLRFGRAQISRHSALALQRSKVMSGELSLARAKLTSAPAQPRALVSGIWSQNARRYPAELYVFYSDTTQPALIQSSPQSNPRSLKRLAMSIFYAQALRSPLRDPRPEQGRALLRLGNRSFAMPSGL